MGNEPSLVLRVARLTRRLEAGAGVETWELEDEVAPGVAFPALVGRLEAGDRVWLNATAGMLDLGTGGVHFVIARVDGEAAAERLPHAFPGREAGHLMKLRYTPLQL